MKKRLLNLLIVSTFTISSVYASTTITVDINKIKVSMPGWIMTGLGDSVVQLFVLDHGMNIIFNQATAITDDQLLALNHDPSSLKSTTSKTFGEIAKVAPELAEQIESALLKPDSFVVLSLTADPSMFKTPTDPSNPCPPCRSQTEQLQQLKQPNITIFHLELGM